MVCWVVVSHQFWELTSSAIKKQPISGSTVRKEWSTHDPHLGQRRGFASSKKVRGHRPIFFGHGRKVLVWNDAPRDVIRFTDSISWQGQQSSLALIRQEVLVRTPSCLQLRFKFLSCTCQDPGSGRQRTLVLYIEDIIDIYRLDLSPYYPPTQ